MKKLFTLLVGAFALISATTIADSEDIIAALKTGTASEVSQYFDNLIDLTLPEKDEIKNMGKNQASIAYKAFYEENGIKGFTLTSQRESGATMYITGKLLGRLGNKNLTLILKNNNSKYVIITVRIS